MDLDRWLETAVADGNEPTVRLPNLRTDQLNKVKVRPETKIELSVLGERIGLGPGGVAALIIEELAAQGMLAQTWRAQNNRRRKALYRLKYQDSRRAVNNPCGCGSTCEDKETCRYLFRSEKAAP